MVVVVLLADFNVSWRIATVKEIKTIFAVELEQGQLAVIHVSEESYPPLTGTANMILPWTGWLTFLSCSVNVLIFTQVFLVLLKV